MRLSKAKPESSWCCGKKPTLLRRLYQVHGIAGSRASGRLPAALLDVLPRHWSVISLMKLLARCLLLSGELVGRSIQPQSTQVEFI